MGTHVLDAFIVKYVLDAQGYSDGEREVESANKRLRDQSKKTFDGMEDGSKKLGTSLRSLRNETIGLGLAFMGANSITGLITGMMGGAASADRLGRTMGMATEKVWAWRMAMKSIPGGNIGEADAALSSIQRARMGWTMGGDTGNNVAYARLGITGNDLRNKDPGAILSKLADAQSKLDPQIYASLLQQIGLPASTIAFLQQGKASVDKLLAQYEKDAAGQEKLAKETEELQKSVVELQTEISKTLVPVLRQLIPPLIGILRQLNRWLGSDSGETRFELGPADDTSSLPKYLPGHVRSARTGRPVDAATLAMINAGRGGGTSSFDVGKHPGGKLTRAERNNNPGNIEDGAFARRQPGYAGSDGRFAKFATAEHGFAAMEALLGSYARKGRRTIASIIAMWAPAHENDVRAYAGSVERQTGINRNQVLTQQQIRTVARAMAKHEGYRGGSVSIGHITVNTKATDANGIARDLGSSIRRHAVSQADRGMNP